MAPLREEGTPSELLRIERAAVQQALDAFRRQVAPVLKAVPGGPPSQTVITFCKVR